MYRVMGIETEYGIAARGVAEDSFTHSLMILAAAKGHAAPSAIWDYAGENPSKDARGFQVEEETEVPGADDNRDINKLVRNGGRLYIDAGHPEYSTPECSNPLDLVTHEKAGELLLARCLQEVNEQGAGERSLVLYKNNSDGKGNSYGCHENYQTLREVPFEHLAEVLAAFLVTRQVLCGAGKVGAENGSSRTTYQISQRADFFENYMGLYTMKKRPIINTRDEPHADPERYRRLHVIVGDANMSEVSTFLKTGATALVVEMAEQGLLDDCPRLADPVGAMKAISRDLECRALLPLADGEEETAIGIQQRYLDHAWAYGQSQGVDQITKSALERWQQTLDQLASNPDQLADEVDWLIKKSLIEQAMERWGCQWDDPRVAMIDLQYHDLRPEKGLYHTLARQGFVKRMTDQERIEHALEHAPENTRAYFRSECIKRYPESVYGASWTSILFSQGDQAVAKVPLIDPQRGTAALVGELLERSQTAEELLANLRA